MVSLYPDGRNAKEREMGVRFQHVPFPCGKFLPFHTVCPEYEQTGTESVEKLSVQNPDQPFQFFPRVKGECLIPIDKGISRFNIRLTLDEVSRPFFVVYFPYRGSGSVYFHALTNVWKRTAPFLCLPVCPHIRNCLLRMPSGISNSGSVVTQGPPSVL